MKSNDFLHNLFKKEGDFLGAFFIISSYKVYFVHYTINKKINQCFFGMFVGFICKLNLNNRIIHIDICCGKNSKVPTLKFQSAIWHFWGCFKSLKPKSLFF
jgi:hypothetical protein